MRPGSRILVAAAVVCAGAAGAVTYAFEHDGPAAASDRDSASLGDVDGPGVARTTFPGLVAPSGDPTLAGLDTARPAVGRVEQVAGPFDDRFVLDRLRVSDGQVRGRLDITSDVSDLLELQVVVGFYDARGAFLGTAQTAYHLDESKDVPDEGPPAEVNVFRVDAPKAYAGRVAAATVGVPVLVNE